MSNIIKERVADFLKHHPPFNFVNESELMGIASQVIVEYYEPDKVLFKQGEKPSDRFYIVREGAVDLTSLLGDKEVLFDRCDEGDIFGIRPLINPEKAYTLSARTSEESLIYSIPAGEFRQIIKSNNRVRNFFETVFESGIRSPYKMYHAQTDSQDINKLSIRPAEFNTPILNKQVITLSGNDSIKDAAKLMRKNNVGSIIIVNDKNHPLGIFTDRDLRNKVVTGEIVINDSIDKIMSSPVITCSKDITFTELQILMIRNDIHHLCITGDGTNDSEVIGIVSEHDILLNSGNNPSVLIREIQRADSYAKLVELSTKSDELIQSYIREDLSIPHVTGIRSEINSTITQKAIEISIAELRSHGNELPSVKWCWLAIGSQGREEQLLKGDQDNAIVFEDVDKESYESIKNSFLSLAGWVNEILKNCGFAYCPSDMMASNPEWCKSLTRWNEQFKDWIQSPGETELMYSTIFFDFKPVYGESRLADTMLESINNEIQRQTSFLSFLAKNALQNPPPLSFFRNIMVEHNGEHKDEFDIKARAMMPVVDGARVLALRNNITGTANTVRRFKHLAELEPENKELYESLAEYYELLIRYRAQQGFKHNDSGRYINPSELNKIQRHMLRNSFKPIKELQELLETRFQLRQFR